MTVLQGLAPTAAHAPRILILGSMPGAESLQQQRYYAHPRNRFWPVMGHVFGVDPQADYSRRIDALAVAGVALWDVLAHCERPGSLDTAIVRTSEIANPIAAWLRQTTSVRVIALNGGKAAEAFDRHVLPQLSQQARSQLTMHRLPSTSPANAAWSLPRLRERWNTLGN